MGEKFQKLTKLVDEISELEARVRKTAQDEFKPALIEAANILKEFAPDIRALRWQQWIPLFNDGDACEFTMGDVSFAFRDDSKVEKFSERKDGFVDPWYFKHLVAAGVINEEQKKLLDDLSSTISRLDGAAELAFGPDVQVTLDLDSMELEVEHYDCGY